MRVATSCKECIFAIRYEDGSQIGCDFNLLGKFQNNGNVVTYDVDDNSYLIEDRICLYCRDKGWLENLGDNPKETVTAQVQLRADAIIYYEEGWGKEKLVATIRAVGASRLKPQRIVVINNGLNMIPFARMALNDTGLPWKITNVIGATDRNTAVQTSKVDWESKFLWLMDAGHSPSELFLYNINIALNHEMMTFSLLKDGNAIFFRDILFKLLGGNQDGAFSDKVEAEAELEGKNNHIIEYQDLCQKLKLQS